MSEPTMPPSLPPMSGQSIPQGSVPATGRIENGDYYFDKFDDRPIPTMVNRLIIEKGSWTKAIIGFVLGGVFLLACVNSVRTEQSVVAMILCFLIGALLIVAGLTMMPRKDYIDYQGFYVTSIFGSKRFPWPHSRTSFYVRNTRAGNAASASARMTQTFDVKLISAEGMQIPLGIVFTGPNSDELEWRGVVQCSRIWDWGVARGYTVETGEYIPLSGAGIHQALRQSQEERYGLRQSFNHECDRLLVIRHRDFLCDFLAPRRCKADCASLNANSLANPLPDHLLGIGIDQLELQRGRAAVDYQNFHITFSFVSFF